MKYRTAFQIHRNMKSAGPIMAILLGLSFSQMSHAQVRTIVYEFTGDLIFNITESCDLDFPALNGTSFLWEGTFDADATPVSTNGVNFDRFAGDISLTLQGQSNLSGTYSPNSNTITELAGLGDNDHFMFSNEAQFTVSDPGFSWTLSFTYVTVPPGFTGAPSPTNTLTPFVPSDVIGHGLFLATHSGPDGDNECIYGIANGVASGTIGSTESVFEDGFEDPQ